MGWEMRFVAVGVAAAAAALAVTAAQAQTAGDPRNPQTMVKVLAGMDAKAEVERTEADQVLMNVSTPGGSFGLQFANCQTGGKSCQGLAFSAAFEKRAVSLAQLNAYNQAELACRGFLAPDGKPYVMYSALITPKLTAEDLKLHVGVWQGCLVSFGEFTSDPTAFLAKAAQPAAGAGGPPTTP